VIHRLLLVGLLLGAIVVPAAAAATTTAEDDGARRVFELHDDRIVESSGLADLGSVTATVNDSGDTSRVFVLDPESGETVGVTDFHTEVTDVEALAPAGPHEVYVGDIGDNNREREEVVVHRVPIGRGEQDVEPASFRLAYPDGPHDAESLFADRSGRLHLITKSFGGGTVYRAPKQLDPDGVNVLEPVGRVRGYVTDAALLRGGRYLLVRSLQQATVYSMPDLEPVGSFALPWQPQGEGVSVGPDGRIRISTEGARTPVYEVQLPAAVARAMRNPQAPTASASPEAVDPPGGVAVEDGGQADHDTSWLGWIAAGVLVAVAVGTGVGLRRRWR
jgi:hypothetical protein